MSKSEKPIPLALALFNGAKQYHLAAETLQTSGNIKLIIDPLYFLLAHAIELALKAYIRINKAPFKAIHPLDELLDDAQQVGLLLSKSTIEAIKILKSENDVQGFRYFLFTSAFRPEVDWLRQSLDELMAIVQTTMDNLPKENETGIVFKGTFGKPVPKTNK